MLGVVEHRGDPRRPQDPKAASGYVHEQYAIELIEGVGSKLVERSEINANPKDTKDYEKSVWTLPPIRRRRRDRDYAAIGESDRFTLKFVGRAMMRLAIVAFAALAYLPVHAQENVAKPAAPTETAAATALKAKGRIRLLGKCRRARASASPGPAARRWKDSSCPCRSSCSTAKALDRCCA